MYMNKALLYLAMVSVSGHIDCTQRTILQEDISTTDTQQDNVCTTNISLAKNEPLVVTHNPALDNNDQDCHTRVRPERKEGLDQTTKEVLFHFGNVIGNFFTLLQDTHNAEHVGGCLQGMLTGMVNIGVAAIKNKKIIEGQPVEFTANEIKELVAMVQQPLTHMVQSKHKKAILAQFRRKKE